MTNFYWFLLLATVLPYVAGPIAVYLLHRSPKQRDFFSLTSDEIISSTSKEFGKRIVGLTQLGFEPVAHLQSIYPSSRLYTSIFHNFSTLERAMVAEITATAVKDGPSTTASYIEINTEFEDGSEVNTNNSATLTVLPAVAGIKTRSFPTFEHGADVYAIHRHFTADLPGERKALPTGEMIRIEIEMAFEKTFRRQCDGGYFWLDDAQNAYRPTLMGAFIMSWKLLWPIGMIRKWQVRSESRRMSRLVAASV